jgi:hypothetical protein
MNRRLMAYQTTQTINFIFVIIISRNELGKFLNEYVMNFSQILRTIRYAGKRFTFILMMNIYRETCCMMILMCFFTSFRKILNKTRDGNENKLSLHVAKGLKFVRVFDLRYLKFVVLLRKYLVQKRLCCGVDCFVKLLSNVNKFNSN